MPAWRPIAERFWAKVDKSDDCWLWTASKNRDGYGTFGIAEGTRLAHRVSFALYHGREAQACVLHTCDKPSCVRPDHLYEGSQRDNAADRSTRNRDGGILRRGERNGRSKLTHQQVAQIRAEYVPKGRGVKSDRSQAAIAARFGVTQTQVSLIVRGKAWSE